MHSANRQHLDQETALLVRVRDLRDEAAFTSLFEALSGRVLGYLVRGGRMTRADGEQTLQEIWTAVWVKAAQFDPSRGAARTWVFAVARNALFEAKRQESRECRGQANFAVEHLSEQSNAECGLDDLQALAHDGARISTLLGCIPPDQAQVLLLAFVEGRSHREIAADTGLPVGTVKSRLRLGVSRLRQLLGSVDNGGEP